MERRDQPHCDGQCDGEGLAKAQAWVMTQRALLTGDQNGGNYPQPEQWDTDYEFVPRVDGVATGDGEIVRLFRVSFTFAILPLYPAPTQ